MQVEMHISSHQTFSKIKMHSSAYFITLSHFKNNNTCASTLRFPTRKANVCVKSRILMLNSSLGLRFLSSYYQSRISTFFLLLFVFRFFFFLNILLSWLFSFFICRFHVYSVFLRSYKPSFFLVFSVIFFLACFLFYYPFHFSFFVSVFRFLHYSLHAPILFSSCFCFYLVSLSSFIVCLLTLLALFFLDSIFFPF